MWIYVLDHGLQWYDRLQLFANGDPFERFVPQPDRTIDIETIGAVLMVLAVVGSAGAILAKIFL